MSHSRSISVQFNQQASWDLRLTADEVDPDELDAKVIARAAIETAAIICIEEAEVKLRALKGDRTRKARNQRHDLKLEIEDCKAWLRHYRSPIPMQVELLGISPRPTAYGARSEDKPTKH
jgi:hypothetical protein